MLPLSSSMFPRTLSSSSSSSLSFRCCSLPGRVFGSPATDRFLSTLQQLETPPLSIRLSRQPQRASRHPIIRYEQQRIQRRGLAGHNKWSKIKRKKGAKDLARATTFTKASRAIVAASRACGGDLANLQLQSAIHFAKSVQLPKDRIQDAIDKHAKRDGADGSLACEELRYDAMMSFGGKRVAVIITALTDNRKRTAANVRTMVHRSGGELLPSASLSYLFDFVGVVSLARTGEDEMRSTPSEPAAASQQQQPSSVATNEIDDEYYRKVFEVAVDAGATDILEAEKLIVCAAPDLWSLVSALNQHDMSPADFEQRYVVSDSHEPIALSKDASVQLSDFTDKVHSDEDVTNVYHNAIVVDDHDNL